MTEVLVYLVDMAIGAAAVIILWPWIRLPYSLSRIADALEKANKQEENKEKPK